MPKVNSANLKWAREAAGLSVEEAARAIGLSGGGAPARLEEIEAGRREPTRPQLLMMAQRYHRPLLTFYLTERPKAGPQTHDLRTLRDREVGSEALVSALVRDVRLRQSLVLDALEDAEEERRLGFVGSVRVNEGPNALAKAIARAINFNRTEYRAKRTFDEAFAYLRGVVEAAGIYVLILGNLGHHTTNISPHVFRGMALADPLAPFIVINETDSRSAWSFTLLHELGHILIGESAISGYDSDQAIEALCDDAAAKVLIDEEEARTFSPSVDLGELLREVADFSKAIKVSRKMLAYNLLRAGVISGASYRDLADRFDEERVAFERRTEGSPDYYVVRRHRVGAGLLNLVHRMVADGVLSSVKAAKVLGVKPTAVSRMTERAA